MTWWFICFGAIILTIFGKWYFADALSRMRRTLSRQQRETLELRETLQDARLTHQGLLRQIKSREIDISRMKKRLAEQQMELRSKAKKPNTESK